MKVEHIDSLQNFRIFHDDIYKFQFKSSKKNTFFTGTFNKFNIRTTSFTRDQHTNLIIIYSYIFVGKFTHFSHIQTFINMKYLEVPQIHTHTVVYVYIMHKNHTNYKNNTQTHLKMLLKVMIRTHI